MESCAVCKAVISGDYKKLSNGKCFHNACWNCSNCGVKLEGQYGITDEGILCPTCVDGCWTCGKLIVCGSQLVKALDHRYHPECFRCEDCDAQLSKYFVRSSEVVCATCILGCGSCSQPVKGRYTNFNDRHYHPECFKCNKCQSQIGGTFKTKNNVPHCSGCV